ncbi:lysine--tRNA ligase [Methanopyrus sp.]
MTKEHWSEIKAREVIEHCQEHADELQDEIVVASGASTSGRLHVGNARDVLTADAVARVLRERYHEDVRVVWVSDDVDPLRRIPRDLDGKLSEDYLGMPYKAIPVGDEPYSDRWARNFVEELREFGVEVDWISSAELYTDSSFAKLVREVVNDYYGGGRRLASVLERFGLEDARVYMPVCEECCRIATTRVVDVDGWRVEYVCEGQHEIGDAVLEGCGHRGELDLKEPIEVNGFEIPPGKLGWRIEWPTRWVYLGVACEPFGKDHYVAGGSYEVGSAIAEEFFGFPAPVPVPYEWITLDGKAMSSSKGHYVTLSDWGEVCHREVLRYLVLRGKPLKHLDLDLRFGLLQAVDDYDELERRYFTGEFDERERRIYELSRVDRIPEECPPHVPFRFCAVVAQVVGIEDDVSEEEFERALEIFRRTGHLESEPEDFGREWLRERLEKASRWVDKYAPEEARFRVRDEPEPVKLSDREREFLENLARRLESETTKEDPETLQRAVFEAARTAGLRPADAFRVFYNVVIGKDRGPRAGTLIAAVGVNRISRLIRGCLEASED